MKVKLSVTLSQQAVYTDSGYEIRVKAIHQDDSSIFSQKILTFNIQKITTFQVVAPVTKAVIAPDESFTFTLEIDNQGNVDSTFVVSALSVPSGWRVTFPDGSSIPISAGSTSSVQVEIASSVDSKNGDSEVITIVVSRTDADGTSEQSKDFTLNVKDVFGGRLISTLEDTWYVFVFLILVIIGGSFFSTSSGIRFIKLYSLINISVFRFIFNGLFIPSKIISISLSVILLESLMV